MFKTFRNLNHFQTILSFTQSQTVPPIFESSSCYGGLSANIICFVCLFEMLKDQ